MSNEINNRQIETERKKIEDKDRKQPSLLRYLNKWLKNSIDIEEIILEVINTNEGKFLKREDLESIQFNPNGIKYKIKENSKPPQDNKKLIK